MLRLILVFVKVFPILKYEFVFLCWFLISQKNTFVRGVDVVIHLHPFLHGVS